MKLRIHTFLYLLAAIPLGALGVALLFAGWLATGLLAVTPLVVPALVVYRTLVGALARVEGALANRLLGTHSVPPVRSVGGPGYWRRASNVLRDGAFWTQQAFLFIRFLLGGTLAILVTALIGGGLVYAADPIWYRWGGQNYGSWHVDTLGRAFLFVPAGVVAIAIGVLLLGPFRHMVRSFVPLLGGGGPAYEDPASAVARAKRRRALEAHAAVVALLSVLTTGIWLATTAGQYYWPVWTIVPLAASLAVHAWTDVVFARRAGGLRLHAGYASIVSLELIAIWAASSRGYFWPGWAMLGLALPLVVHWAMSGRFRRQAQRIAQLETSRAGAVAEQGAEARRIERDLHDGAQAQLVALGMSIGMAEQKLASDPEAARALLLEARRGAQDALEELRGLARGIHPPVLTDRGLAAAIATLTDRTPLDLHVSVALEERPPEPVETAAYFVVAEALANAGKHSAASRVAIDVHRADGTLVVQVEDDGRGGADAGGHGLRGLARRVQALDGTLAVTSPAGGPTIVRAVMPCAS